MSGDGGLTHGLDEATLEQLRALLAPGPEEKTSEPEQLDELELADLLAARGVETDPDDVGIVLDGAPEDEGGPEGKYDTSPVGTPGGRQNWIDRAGGLPPFIRAVAHALIREGRPKGTAIAIAVGTIRRWAAGGGNVSAKTRAKAVKTIAQWEKMRASARTKTDPAVPAGTPTTEEAAMSGSMTKDVAQAAGGYDYKEAKVSVVDVVDEERGIVAAIVSVTGILDRVGDIIMPGAYAKSLTQRTPKGVWSHSWERPVSKTLEVRELLPGDPMLSGLTLRDGSPWPAEAGALWVKTQFNLEGDRGRQAFADVKFFGADQEWSIGYNVPKGKAEMKGGIRHIHELDLYEFSPVLFGAMPSAMTLTVKSAQEGFKALMATLGTDELKRAADLRAGVETKDGGPDKAQRNEDGEPTDAGKPHKFAPKPDGKCKVCGLAIAGHMKAQKESATGDEKGLDEYLEEVMLGAPDDLDTKAVRDFVRDMIGRFADIPGRGNDAPRKPRTPKRPKTPGNRRTSDRTHAAGDEATVAFSEAHQGELLADAYAAAGNTDFARSSRRGAAIDRQRSEMAQRRRELSQELDNAVLPGTKKQVREKIRAEADAVWGSSYQAWQFEEVYASQGDTELSKEWAEKARILREEADKLRALAAKPDRKKKSDEDDLERKAWAPCSECGSRDADEYADGSPARCSDCGNAMKAAAAGADATKTLAAVIGVLRSGGMSVAQVKAALEEAGVPEEDADLAELDGDEDLEDDDEGQDDDEKAEQKGLLTEQDLQRMNRLRLALDA